jgi:hypothetical protein
MLKLNYQIGLLAALVLLILLPLPVTIFPERLRLFVSLAYSILIFFGIKTCSDSRRHLVITGTLGAIGLVAIWAAYYFKNSIHSQWFKFICLLVFYCYLAVQLFLQIKKNRAVDLNIIFASVSGYLLIGAIGGFVFQLLTLAVPGSFKGLAGPFETYGLQYFSYITLTSVGYGDISPATEAAQSLVLLLALSGQIYLTVLVAILVGKYLSEKPNISKTC